METNSFVNQILAQQNQTPTVGMGVTRLRWTDRSAYTVVKICTQRKIIVRRDRATLIGGSCATEKQEYQYEPGPEGYDVTVTLRKDGCWRGSNDMGLFHIGNREEYSDPTF
jgi:hypothetical protein